MNQDRLRALLVVLVMLSFTNFDERIFRTRSEPLALFFATAALLLILRNKSDHCRAILAAGFLSGLSFLTTQKAIYFDLALGLALVVDALVARKLFASISRGALLVLGWCAAIAAYCIGFGGMDALRVLENLFFAPVQGAVHGADPYGSLRGYVVQTLTRNMIPYMACFLGIGLAFARFRELDATERKALVFTVVITALVFAHNQPWPYVFIMAIPFLSLWVPYLVNFPFTSDVYRKGIWTLVLMGFALSLVSNFAYFRRDNRDQIELMERAEALLGPGEQYFNGTAMLPNRPEVAPWLDRAGVLATLELKEDSGAYISLSERAPELLIWNYRLEDIRPVIGEIVQERYVRVAPNLWMSGRRLEPGRSAIFQVTKPARYAAYSEQGEPVDAALLVDGQQRKPPFDLTPGRVTIIRQGGGGTILLVPEGDYRGKFSTAPNKKGLFDGVYD